jgi:hypothetical protein
MTLDKLAMTTCQNRRCWGQTRNRLVSRNHLSWQPRVQVWYWLSHEARQGAPSTAGHIRLQFALVLEQLARHASEDAVA